MARRAIVLVTLTLVGGLVGHGTSQWIAAALLDAPSRVVIDDAAPTTTTRVVDPCALLTGHSFFDSALDVQCEGEPPRPPITHVEPTETPSCDGALRLIGTVVPRGAARTPFAAIADASGGSLLYTMGMHVGDRQVAEIERDHVVLEQGTTSCVLAMFEPRRGVSLVDHAPPPLAHASPADSGIRATGPASFAIDRATLERLVTGSELLTTIRAIVHEDASGAPDGARIYGVREGSVVSQLGLANGDVLHAVDRYSLADPTSALEAVAALRTASEVTLRVTRRGMPLVLTYAIE